MKRRHSRTSRYYILRAWAHGVSDGQSSVRGDFYRNWPPTVRKAYEDGYREGQNLAAEPDEWLAHALDG